MSNWNEGHESRTWYDGNIDSTNGHATFSNCSTNNFVISAYRENFGPDTRVASESMQCSSSADAVYWGDVRADNYHWTLHNKAVRYADVKTYY